MSQSFGPFPPQVNDVPDLANMPSKSEMQRVTAINVVLQLVQAGVELDKTNPAEAFVKHCSTVERYLKNGAH